MPGNKKLSEFIPYFPIFLICLTTRFNNFNSLNENVCFCTLFLNLCNNPSKVFCHPNISATWLNIWIWSSERILWSCFVVLAFWVSCKNRSKDEQYFLSSILINSKVSLSCLRPHLLATLHSKFWLL